MPEHEIGTHDPLPVRTHEINEPEEQDMESNRLAYLSWLESQHAITYLQNEDEGKNGFVPTGMDEDDVVLYPNYFYVRVRDIRPVVRVENESKVPGTMFSQKDEYAPYRYIRMREDGAFEYGTTGKIKEIKFKSRKSLYYAVFRSLYELAPHHKDYVPYEAIEASIVRMGQNPKPGEEGQQRIRDAVAKSLIRNATKLQLPRKIEGTELFMLVPGKGYRFYNPTTDEAPYRK